MNEKDRAWHEFCEGNMELLANQHFLDYQMEKFGKDYKTKSKVMRE